MAVTPDAQRFASRTAGDVGEGIAAILSLLGVPGLISFAGGLAGPLDAVASRLEATQGRRPAEDELLIASGAIEGLELVSKTFLDPGDVAVVEAPTYLGAIMAFRGYDAALVAVSMDEHGLRVDELEQRLADGVHPKLLYTIPDHQNPAGVSTSTERRERLVELARRHGFLIVEDVAYRELGFDDDAPPT